MKHQGESGLSYVVAVKNRTFASTSYLCLLERPGSCLVIDPGLDVDLLEAEFERLGVVPIAILLTHGHFDHIGSASILKQKYAAPTYMHRADLAVIKSANFVMMACKIKAKIEVPTIDYLLDGDQVLQIAGEAVRFLEVPGHTPGSCFICYREAVFSGDSLYRQDMGKVEFPGEDRQVLRHSLLKIWREINDQDWIFPGHGHFARFAEIKVNNRVLLEFLNLDSLAPDVGL